jgi:hypothetical protein
VALGACSQPAPVAPTAAATAGIIEGATPQGTTEAHFNPTEAIGGGSNASVAVSAQDLARVFAAVQQISQLNVTASTTPPGANGPDVTGVSVIANDKGSLLKGLDPNAKKNLGEALMDAAAAAWPNADVSLLVTDPSGTGGTIVGSRAKGGPNTVFTT